MAARRPTLSAGGGGRVAALELAPLVPSATEPPARTQGDWDGTAATSPVAVPPPPDVASLLAAGAGARQRLGTSGAPDPRNGHQLR